MGWFQCKTFHSLHSEIKEIPEISYHKLSKKLLCASFSKIETKEWNFDGNGKKFLTTIRRNTLNERLPKIALKNTPK